MSAIDEIKALKELVDSGALSEEEFQIEKNKLLNPPQPKASNISQPVAPAAPGSDAALGLLVPVNTNGAAIACSYLGLIGLLIPILGLIAIPVGVLALKKIKENPGQGGAARQRAVERARSAAAVVRVHGEQPHQGRGAAAGAPQAE